MSLSVFLLGKDSELFDMVETVFKDAVHQIKQRVPEASDLVLGNLTESHLGETIGSASDLHRLRGYAAQLELEGQPPSLPTDELSALKQIYEGDAITTQFKHLIHHSDCGGYYLPLDFPEPIFLARRSFAIGTDGPIGSSQQLLKELEKISQHLKIPTDYEEFSPEDYFRSIEGDIWQTEKWACCILYWLTQESVKRNLVLVFG